MQLVIKFVEIRDSFFSCGEQLISAYSIITCARLISVVAVGNLGKENVTENDENGWG